MHQIRRDPGTTPAKQAETAHRSELSSTLAKRLGGQCRDHPNMARAGRLRLPGPLCPTLDVKK